MKIYSLLALLILVTTRPLVALPTCWQTLLDAVSGNRYTESRVARGGRLISEFGEAETSFLRRTRIFQSLLGETNPASYRELAQKYETLMDPSSSRDILFQAYFAIIPQLRDRGRQMLEGWLLRPSQRAALLTGVAAMVELEIEVTHLGMQSIFQGESHDPREGKKFNAKYREKDLLPELQKVLQSAKADDVVYVTALVVAQLAQSKTSVMAESLIPSVVQLMLEHIRERDEPVMKFALRYLLKKAVESVYRIHPAMASQHRVENFEGEFGEGNEAFCWEFMKPKGYRAQASSNAAALMDLLFNDVGRNDILRGIGAISLRSTEAETVANQLISGESLPREVRKRAARYRKDLFGSVSELKREAQYFFAAYKGR